MNNYNIIITPDAEQDLNELDDYITFQLMSPGTAISYIRTIREKISELQIAPKRHRVIDDEPWHSRCVRRMNVKNFAVFYYVNEEYFEVYILNVIYQGRDLSKILPHV